MRDGRYLGARLDFDHVSLTLHAITWEWRRFLMMTAEDTKSLATSKTHYWHSISRRLPAWPSHYTYLEAMRQ